MPSRLHFVARLALLGLALAALPLPAPGAEIGGTVSHRDDRPGSGLPVRLLGIQGGETFTRAVTSDATGRFRFTDLTVPGAYLVIAEYRGVAFHADPVRFGENDAADSRRALVIEVHEPSSDPSQISLERLRLVVEQEAGAYRIDHLADVRHAGDRVVALADGAPPVLELALLPGHGELRTPMGVPPAGYVEQENAMVLRGPVYPGAREVVFSYHVPTAGVDLKSELRLPGPVPVLELYVRDEGVAIEAGALHPARVARDDAGNAYQRYVGFDLPAGTTIPISVRARPLHRPASRGIEAALAAALGAALFFFVARPVTRARREEPEAAEDAEGLEKQALYAALRDLEHDYETGKLSGEDRERLREELRRDALLALARQRDARRSAEGPADAAAAEAEPEATPSCAKCGRAPGPDDRFCAACGAPL